MIKNVMKLLLLLFVMLGISSANMHAELTIDPMIFVINYKTFFIDSDLSLLYQKMVDQIYDGSLCGVEIQNALSLARERAEELYIQNKENSLMAIILSLYSLELFMR